MNKHYCLTVLTALLFSITLSAQFNLEWQQPYGFFNLYEKAVAVHTEADGSSIVGIIRLTSNNIGTNNRNVEIFRYNPLGNVDWQTNLGSSDNDFLTDLIVDPNGDILTIGFRSNQSGIWVVKLNASGTVLWNKQVRGNSYASGNSIIATSDGGYFIVSNSTDEMANNPIGRFGTWGIKLDSNGNIQWDKVYGGFGIFAQFQQVAETPQGDFILAGQAFGAGGDILENNGDYDFWILKVNATGNIIWSKNYGGIGPEFVRSLNLLADDNMILSGTTNSHATGDVSQVSGANTNLWVVKLDTNGNLIWEKSIGGDFFENGGYSEVAPSGEIYIATSTESSNGDFTPGKGKNDIWVMRLDRDGNILDTNNFGGSELDNLQDISLNGNHLVVVGNTLSSDGDVVGYSGGGSGDAWILNLTTPTLPPSPTGCNPDVTPPVWSNCPNDIMVSNGSPTQVNWTPPTATDVCSFANFTSNFAPSYVFPLGTTRVIYTSSDQSNNVATCEFNVSIQPQTGGNVDLELSVVQNDANPQQWGFYTVTATLNNTGSQAANDVEVEWLSPNGVAYQGGNEFTASQGSFEHWGNEIWTVGTIPAGGSATLEVSYFLLNPTPPVSYAQVNSMTGTDADSTPGNGTSPTPNEDDEASTNSSNPPPPPPPSGCSPDITPPVISNCPNDIAITSSTPTTVNWTSLTAIDNCGTPTLTSTFSQNHVFSFGSTNVTYTATDQAGNMANCQFLVTINQQPTGGNDIDLELSLIQNDANPQQWGFYTVTATLNNTGSQTANNVEVEWLAPNGATYQGGNEFTASQGDFTYFSDEIWSVGTIPAGGSATMEVSYFLLQPNAPTAYAQVSAMNGTDSDSTPSNGTPPTPNEDDEASTNGSNPPPPPPPANLPDLTVSNLSFATVPMFVAPGEVLDYTFNLRNVGNAIAAGNYQINAYISNDLNLSADDIQDGIIPTGNTAAGTDILVPGASTIPSNLPAGNYYIILVADDGNVINESNENNNSVVSVFAFTVQGTPPPPPPSGNGADLSMSIITTTGIPQWANFSVTYVITNGSATTATGVKAQIQKPDQVVYTGGNEFNTAQGTFDIFGTETWDVGTIGPGDQAVFTANYFRVSADAVDFYGQITAADQSDPDSTPGNGSCCVTNEDDEAARSLLPAFSGINNRSTAFETNKNQITFLQTVFPNPTSDQMTVRMIAKESSETEIQVIDNLGRVLISENWELEQGVNEKTIDLSSFPAGLYQVTAQPFHPYLRKARVMKVGN